MRRLDRPTVGLSFVSYGPVAVFRRLLRTFVLLIAVLGLLPDATWAVVEVAGLIAGEPVSTGGSDEADPVAAERGCTPISHVCPCHQSQGASAQAKPEAGSFSSDHWLAWMLEHPQSARQVPQGRRLVGNDLPPANRSTAPPTPPANA